MYRRVLIKDDGRRLALYACDHVPEGDCAPSPAGGPTATGDTHVRWHPLRGEWVAYASHRQHRTFLPLPDYNPLAPSCDARNPTEVPTGTWEVAVFENLFPTLTFAAPEPPTLSVPTGRAQGVCEVVVFTQDTRSSLGALPLWHLELLIDVWADRHAELSRRADVQYVFAFENRGPQVGATLHHPHGQIYGYPFIPPIAARELELQHTYLERHRRGLIQDLVQREVSETVRTIYVGAEVAAFVPICARYPYEVWIAPHRPAGSFADLTKSERADLAAALKTVLLKLDGLWQEPLPYVLVFHQSPSDGLSHPEAHLHAEIYPALRMKGRLKYLAGSEIGAGVFTADTLPEQTAAELRAVPVDIRA